jgi:hypothetical protein
LAAEAEAPVRTLLIEAQAHDQCEAITQPPAPSHQIARGRARPKLLAHVLFAKYGLHMPLHHQSDVYQREGIDTSMPRRSPTGGPLGGNPDADPKPSLAAERIHADDTTVPVLAKGKAGRFGPMCAKTARWQPRTAGGRVLLLAGSRR